MPVLESFAHFHTKCNRRLAHPKNTVPLFFDYNLLTSRTAFHPVAKSCLFCHTSWKPWLLTSVRSVHSCEVCTHKCSANRKCRPVQALTRKGRALQLPMVTRAVLSPLLSQHQRRLRMLLIGGRSKRSYATTPPAFPVSLHPSHIMLPYALPTKSRLKTYDVGEYLIENG